MTARLLFAWSALFIAAHLVFTYVTDSPEARCASVGAEAGTLTQLDGSRDLMCYRFNPARGVVEYPAAP